MRLLTRLQNSEASKKVAKAVGRRQEARPRRGVSQAEACAHFPASVCQQKGVPKHEIVIFSVRFGHLTLNEVDEASRTLGAELGEPLSKPN